MNPWCYFAELLLALALAPLCAGIINRVKAKFSRRHGKPLLQLYYDIFKLLFKGEVIGEGTTWVFSAGPVIAMISSVAALALLPLGGAASPLAFQGDFILCAYLLGMGRFATILAALDTGSPFEGMGASREALFGARGEPVLFLALLALITTAESLGVQKELSLSTLFNGFAPRAWLSGRPELIMLIFVMGVLLLVENCRIPVDDPNTHLELTMIHEVMILDHSGPNLAFILYGSAIKLWLFSSLLTGLVIPAMPVWAHTLCSLFGVFLACCAVGVIESVMARLRMHVVPALAGLAGSVAAFVLILTLVR